MSDLVRREQNDRLLELAGGCRHEWGDWIITRIAKCARCGVGWYPRWREGEDWADLPAVGDGHQMTLGEMVRLWAKLYDHSASCEVWLWEDGWRAKVGGIVWSNPPERLEREADADTPEAALAAAILAAAGAR